jgi:hypothetical protein
VSFSSLNICGWFAAPSEHARSLPVPFADMTADMTAGKSAVVEETHYMKAALVL